MVREARARVQAGELGTIRVIQVEYPQDWLTTKLEDTGQKQASWRTDPAQSGGGAIGDIGVTRLQPRGLHHRPRRRSRCAPTCRPSSPAAGSTTTATCCCATRAAPAACCGPARWRPATRTRCASGSMATRAGWSGSRNAPTSCTCSPSDSRRGRSPRAGAGAGPAAAAVSRIPPGHVEGYLEAFANIYTGCAELITARLEGREPADRGAPRALGRGRRAGRAVHHRGGRVQLARRRLDRARSGAVAGSAGRRTAAEASSRDTQAGRQEAEPKAMRRVAQRL